MTSAAQRLPRLLALVPYLLSRPGMPVADVAADFGVSEPRLRRDLELLWMCGLPGYGPGDLIDLSFDGATISVTHDAGMRRPLRMTTTEATALLVALRALADSSGVTDTDAVQRALVKVENAVGQVRSDSVVVRLENSDKALDPTIRDTVRQAVASRKALWMRYYTASRDEISQRTVDPMRLILVDGHNYLEAWCRSADGVRLFRLDRVDEVRIRDEAAIPPEEATPTDVSGGLFRPMPEQDSAVLELDPDARWVAEYYPVDEFEELPGGAARIRMRYADRAWMVRLVLGLGGTARVHSPAELAREIRHRAEEAVRRVRRLPLS